MLVLSLGLPEARADAPADVAKARELFLEGSKLSESGDWEGARDRFERSLKLKHAALTLYNLGIAQQETGRLVAAIESFHAFLAMPPEPATQPFVDPVRTVVATLEVRVPLVNVEVRPGAIPGTVLRIDGRDAPASGPRRLDPGHHDFVVSAPGYCDAIAHAALVEGGRTTVALRLAQAPLPPAPSVQLPTTIAAGGLVLLVGGTVMLGIGAAGGVRSAPDPNATKLMLAGGAVEGASAIALGAAAVLLLTTRNKPQAASARIVPWASGPVGGVALRF